MPTFERYIGIDYSGAKTSTASNKALRVYLAEGGGLPTELKPPPSRRKYWTRKGIAHCLVKYLAGDVSTLVGIDHGFSFPLCYFDFHNLEYDWPSFLDDFQGHWPTDKDHVSVHSVRKGRAGNGAARCGNTRWRRAAEKKARGAKSVFHFGVPGQVATSTHAGLPWLRFIRREVGDRVFFWPFDGWDIPQDKSVIAEVYPALWSGDFTRHDRTNDQHDAYSTAAWMSRADRSGRLSEFFNPNLSVCEYNNAKIEGWILGVPELTKKMKSD